MNSHPDSQSCLKLDEVLDFDDGERALRLDLVEHLERCPRCRETHREWLSVYAPPLEVCAPSFSVPRGNRRRLMRLAGVAAAVLLLLGGGFVWMDRDAPSSRESSPEPRVAKEETSPSSMVDLLASFDGEPIEMPPMVFVVERYEHFQQGSLKSVRHWEVLGALMTRLNEKDVLNEKDIEIDD